MRSLPVCAMRLYELLGGWNVNAYFMVASHRELGLNHCYTSWDPSDPIQVCFPLESLASMCLKQKGTNKIKNEYSIRYKQILCKKSFALVGSGWGISSRELK